MREFSTPAVLSVSTGILVSDTFGDVHEVIEYMAGGPVWTHQIPRYAEPCASALHERHPGLSDVEGPQGRPADEIAEWVNEQRERWGDTMEVPRLSVVEQAENVRDPISELAEMIGPDRAVPVVVNETSR